MIHVLTDDVTVLKPSLDTYTHSDTRTHTEVSASRYWASGHATVSGTADTYLITECSTIPVFKTSANLTSNSDVFYFSFSFPWSPQQIVFLPA